MKQKLMAAIVAAGIVGFAGIAGAQTGHEHHHAPAAMTLNQGAKWETDAPLRQGMSAIRASVETDGHAGKYAAVAGTIEGQIAYMVENCKLEPAADEVLHGVLAQLLEGVEVLKGQKAGVASEDGVAHVATALDSYGEHFDHPGWKPMH